MTAMMASSILPAVRLVLLLCLSFSPPALGSNLFQFRANKHTTSERKERSCTSCTLDPATQHHLHRFLHFFLPLAAPVTNWSSPPLPPPAAATALTAADDALTASTGAAAPAGLGTGDAVTARTGAAVPAVLCARAACKQGLRFCPSLPPYFLPPKCANLSSDPLHCGFCSTACYLGGICSKGKCACPKGTVFCPRAFRSDTVNSEPACTDLSTDRWHCGKCGRVCSWDQTCVSGKCQCKQKGLTFCLNRCVDFRSDPRNCGACFVDCERQGTCQNGRCLCPQGQRMCSTDPVNPCKDLQNDLNNCGSCGNMCPEPSPFGFVKCVKGKCVCPRGTEVKGCQLRICTNFSRDAENCGRCNKVCDFAAGEVCRSGRCVCPPGTSYKSCPDNTRPGKMHLVCTNFSSDPGNCGGCERQCNYYTGEICARGRCQCPKGTSLKSCPPSSSSCSNFSSDAHNCGGCSRVCPGKCIRGKCLCPLGGGKTWCPLSGICTNTETDNFHCRGCSNTCDYGSSCVKGKCTCPPRSHLSLCVDKSSTGSFSSCKNLLNDTGNCGKCKSVCPTGASCIMGKCRCPAGTSTMLCKGEKVCTNFKTDPFHCGGCFKGCSFQGACLNGKCGCPVNFTSCEWGCRDLSSDPENCGRCDNVCPWYMGQSESNMCCAGKCNPSNWLSCSSCGHRCEKGKRCVWSFNSQAFKCSF